MQERPKSGWSTGEKRQWATPKMREIPLTSEILAHFELSDSTSLPGVEPAKKVAANR